MVKTTRSAALRLRLVVTEHQENMGRRIRERREALVLSRDEVARRMGAIAAERGEVDKTNGNAIYRWEEGQVTPGPRKLDLLAGALGVQVAYFLMDAPAEGTPDLMTTLRPARDEELSELHSRLDDLQEAVDRIEGYLQEQASKAVRDRVRRAAQQQRRRRGEPPEDQAAADG